MRQVTAKRSAVYGYHISDEPGASYFPALAKAVQAVKKYAPGKLAYINIYPNYATLGAKDNSQLQTESYEEYLERFVKEVKPQFISYDNYMVLYSQDLEDSVKAARYYNNLMDVRRIAFKNNLPFWNTVSSNQIRPFTTIPSPANLRFQTYTTLTAGGSGVKWYTYYSRNFYGYAPIDKTDSKSLTWQYLQQVNREIVTLGPIMNRLKSTGVYFTSPPPVDTLPVLSGKLVKSIDSDTHMMVGEFTEIDGSNYIIVVNLSLKKSVNFIIKTVSSHKKTQIVSAVDGSLKEIDPDTGHWLVAGQGILIKLQ